MMRDVMTGSAVFMVQVLGQPSLRDVHGALRPLERKAAALLAYLAIEGHTPRGRLTSLLWPETREDAARNNLVHLLRKLASLAGVPLVEGRETLALHPEVRVDVQSLFLAGEAASGVPLPVARASLLATHDFDDCPELEEWLCAERERLEEWWLLILRERATLLEAQEAHEAALGVVLRLLDLDPLSEDAHRRLMRLHTRMGNRHRALRAYERLCALLRREFGAEPLPETVTLAQSLYRPLTLASASSSLISA
ncbi:AfsR/SARP family transcriptional regulator [Deinococcus yavapaiensis]|uniref:DNA-binding SARP family transcriptional activator n=1 Tax=Deinococcus yavapaiensis KR-236 TaxID=694435 RepID=A0A318S005_9DEIO|nr:BTAD domain-containing putative transcriptional regulator [Deinococcus yavapaiensis]PYE48106.1 DNA-binding SARP family transcriptional activator [Deinococcus yavapaiensis KR-236]